MMWTDDRPRVPCGLCGTPTPMTGTKRCDRCWELESRIHGDSVLAQKILDDMNKQSGGEVNIEVTVRDGTWVGTYAEWCRRNQVGRTAPPSAPVGVEAIKSAIAELDALRNAMFKTYAAAANGADKAKLLRLIEAERNAYEAHYSLPKLQAALATANAASYAGEVKP